MPSSCASCRVSIPEGARFCPGCGRAASTTTSEPRSRSVWVACFVAILVGFAMFAAMLYSRSQSAPTVQRATVAAVGRQPKPVSSSLLNKTVDLRAGQYYRVEFNVIPEAKNVRLKGRAEAAGGANNDMRVFVFTQEQFLNWTKLPRPLEIVAVFDSGRGHLITLDVPLANSGRYYVVIDNSFSLLSGKTVVADISLAAEL
jgi:hypothetical protein